jgi:asparagine synthase (glutamine-hydrolysing)
MCGIAGLIDYRGTSSLEDLKSMTKAISHRGPDDSGHFWNPVGNYVVGLGHRRLSIIDTSESGHQPMSFDGLHLVFNGEVYNFKEIRRELIASGYSFESQSDTEVVLKAFHLWGVNSISRFNGMFAGAIYDSSQKKLFLFRDRAGVKPLHWFFNDELFLFASELKCLCAHIKFSKNIDAESLGMYLRHGYVSEPRSIYIGVNKLQAGSYIEYDCQSRKFSHKEYWNISKVYASEIIYHDIDEAQEKLELLLQDACNYRMIADVPVGVFLSGGYDSSLVAALVQKNSATRIKTFTIGFENPIFNEAGHARAIAYYLNTDHHDLICTVSDAKRIIPLLPDIWDEPLADDSVIPTYLVSEFASKYVKVTLSADGGDEVFGGYRKYSHIVSSERMMKYFQKLPPSLRNLEKFMSYFPSDGVLSGRRANLIMKVLRTALSGSAVTALERYQDIFTPNELKHLAGINITDGMYGFDRSLYQNLNSPVLAPLMAADFATYMRDCILTKVDRATMAVGLEGREPLLDYRLIEFAASLHPNLKIKDGQLKFILKKITHKYIPKELLDRPKQGFSSPLNDWFSGALKELLFDTLSRDALLRHGIFDPNAIQAILRRFEAGDTSLLRKIWSIFVFQLWYDKWMT